jgi:tripartite-type tricarboxylate transporter receptor subunit TctC
MSMRFAFVLGIALASPLLATAQTDSYPSHPIRFIVANAAGGGEDSTARALAVRLSGVLGQQVIIDNRPGAAGSIAAELTAKSPPDGYTIMLGSVGSLSVNPSLYRKLAYDPLRDLAPVSMIVVQSNILVVNPSVPARNVRELIALAKAQAGKMTFGSSGSGNAGHLAGELFKNMAKVDMVHVPYKGGAAAMNDLLGGRIDMVFSSAATALPQMKAGRIRGLAVTTRKRSPLVPDLPTIAESGLPGYEAANWYGMVVPIKTPQPIVERLNAAVVQVLNDPETKSVLANQGLEAAPSTSKELGAHMRSEASKWAKVIKAVGITPD